MTLFVLALSETIWEWGGKYGNYFVVLDFFHLFGVKFKICTMGFSELYLHSKALSSTEKINQSGPHSGQFFILFFNPKRCNQQNNLNLILYNILFSCTKYILWWCRKISQKCSRNIFTQNNLPYILCYIYQQDCRYKFNFSVVRAFTEKVWFFL